MTYKRGNLVVRGMAELLFGIRFIVRCRGFVGLAILAVLCGPTVTRVGAQGYLTNIGVPTYTTSVPVESGSVDLQNGDLHLSIPIGSFPQRAGRTLNYAFVYDSSIWHTPSGWQPTNVPNATGGASWGGWRLVSSGDAGSVSFDWNNYGGLYISDEFNWTAPDGTSHDFNIETVEDCTSGTCVADPETGDSFATDASGYHMFVNTFSNATVYAPDGTIVYGFWYGQEDPNGNYISYDVSGNLVDTLGRTLVTKATCSDTCYDVLGADGSTKRYTIKTTTVDVSTNFLQTGVAEYSTSTTVPPITTISEIDLPDGTKYQFSYDSGTAAGHYGTLISMTLPTGGSISYGYSVFSDAYGNKGNWLTSRVTSGTGVTGGTWTYTPVVNSTCSTSTSVNCQQKNTVHAPSGDETVYTFNLNGGPWNSLINTYTGSASSGTLLATVTNAWDYTVGCPTYALCGDPGAYWVLQTTKTTTLPIPGGNINSATTYTWDSSGDGNPTEIDEYNFFAGAMPSTPDRKTTISYLGGSSYLAANIVNRPEIVTVYDASSTIIAKTYYSYDQSTPVSFTGRTHHDDTNYGSSNTVRGNLTAVQPYVGGSTYLTKFIGYDMLGNVLTSTDFNSDVTSYDYTDNFYDDPGDGSTPTGHSLSTPTNAYLKTITYPTVGSVTVSSTFGYYWGTGQQALATDANSNTTYSHFHDPLMRPTSTALPNSGWTRVLYNSTDTQVDLFTGTTSSSASTSCTVCRHDQSVLDALGRPITNSLVNDPDGQTYVGTAYDSDGRVSSIGNPYRGTSSGGDTPAYDGMNRTTQVTHADSDAAHTYYGAAVGSAGGASSQSCSASTYGYGYPVLVVDEIGNKRQTWTNGFGKVIETDEPNASGTLNVYTCYTYDANHNLIGVAGQSGQTRGYSYDAMSRVASTTTPESGTTYFYYTASGGGLCSGDPSAVCQRTDSRSITTTYAYDALNRLTSKTYSDTTTPMTFYVYDLTSSVWGEYLSNPKGRLVGVGTWSSANGFITAENFGYNAIGEITRYRSCSPAHCNDSPYPSPFVAFNYTYDFDGNLTSITYPGGRTVTYSVGNAERAVSAVDSSNSINYATAPSSGVMYSPWGAPENIIHGAVSGGFAGITESYTFNNRLQVTGIEATSTNGTPLNLSYSYVQSSHDNGNITTQTNNTTSGRTQTYTYDPLSRLLSAQAAATSGGDCWGQNFGNNATPPTLAADALNNLANINNIKCSSPALSVTASTSTNRFGTGYSYDSVGNNTADSLNSYTYDAENQIISASAGGTYYCYTYDGFGQRIQKATASSSACSSPTAYELYWRSISGDTLAETDGSGSTTNSSYKEYVFFAGRRIAQSTPSTSTVNYYFADHLGSTRVVTNATGTACYEADFLPYGTENTPASFTNTCSTNYKFTGYERDSETGLDYAFARYYNQRMGRFGTGDPLAGDIGDPQTLNRYSYARNNPVNFIDPGGNCTDQWVNGVLVCTVTVSPDPGPCEIDPWFCETQPFSCGLGPCGSGGGGLPPQPPMPPPPSLALLGYTSPQSTGTHGPTAPSNPCQYQGRALSPSDYATMGKSAPWYSLNFALDVHYGWGSGQYLDAQPLTNVPGTWNAAAYGNYIYGVYMQSANVSPSVALRGAEAYALTKTYPRGTPMQPGYPGLPAANAQNIMNGYNGQANGTTCHQ